MTRAGRPMDIWQQDGITLMLSFRADGRWACYEYCEWCARQNGKGVILEARVLTGFLLLGERLILWSAHEYKTAMEAFRRVLQLLRNLGRKITDNLYEVDGIPIKVINTNGEEGLERLDTYQRIRFIARSKGSGRGFDGPINIIDETFAYTQAQQDALMPTMSAQPNPQIIYTSSPPLTPDTGEVMFKLRLRGDPTAPRSDEDGAWQQDDALGYRDWGLAGDLENLEEIDLADPELAAASNPGLSIRITMETVRREQRSMGAEGFARERLGIWPRRAKTGSGVISAELWRDLIDPDRVHPTDRAFAVVVAADRSHTAIVAVGPRQCGEGLLISIADYRPGTRWVPSRLVDLRDRWRPVGIAAQDKGPTGALGTAFEVVGLKPDEDEEHPVRGSLVVPWAADVAAAYGMFVDAVRARELWHLDEAPLNTALYLTGTRPLSTGTAWDYRDPAAVTLLAATLAYWTWITRHDLVVDTYDPLANFW